MYERVNIYVCLCLLELKTLKCFCIFFERKRDKNRKVLYKTEGVCQELHHEAYISMCECVCVDKPVSVLYNYHSANNWRHGMCM